MCSCRNGKVELNPYRAVGSAAVESTHRSTDSLLVGVSLAGHVLPACDIGQRSERRINKSVLKRLTPAVNLSFLERNWLRRNVRK